jgi:hypothetical protein
MLRLAHELAQNRIVVVFFSPLLPEQLLANTEALNYFRSIHFLCLTCSPDTLSARIGHREGIDANFGADSPWARWSEFQRRVENSALETPTATLLDASGTMDHVEAEVRNWINALLAS